MEEDREVDAVVKKGEEDTARGSIWGDEEQRGGKSTKGKEINRE